jgi:hypothetical protein
MKRAETDREDIQSLARAHAADAIAVLAEIMNNSDAPAGARLSAAKALLDRGWGKAGAKPPEDGNRAPPVSQIRRVIVDPCQHNAKRPSQPANAASLQARSGGQRGIAKSEERLAAGQRNGPVDHFERRTLRHVPRPRCARIARRRIAASRPKSAVADFVE